MSITIIIPTFTNTEGFSKLIYKLKLTDIPIMVIDNQSTKEKRELCNVENVNYFPQKKNTGFARAINIGAKEAKTEWLLILNDDVVIKHTKYIDQLLKFAEKNNYSAVSPVLRDNKGNIENIGYRVLPIGRVELNFDMAKFDQRTLDGLTAACLLIRKKDFDAMGGFDARFFAYLEDVDLFLRMKRKGYSFGVDRNIEVMHKKNATSSRMGKFKQKQDLKNWFLVIWKNWDRKKLLRNLLQIIIERLRNLSGYIKA